jgi:tetratricopeptide (TPR) repeat protein
LNGIVENLRVQLEAAGTVRVQRGDPPFPPMPPELADNRLPPEQRLEGILQYLRRLLPNEKDHCVVVGLMPLECPNFRSYAQLIGSIMPIADVLPWMAPLRIVVYDDRSQKLLTTAMRSRQVAHVLTFEVDFSTPALTDSLTRDASDTSLPIPERMACLMQLAALDYSYKRYPDALQKYGVLYNYYEEQKIPAMQALCLHGAGDTLRGGGQPAAAKDMMQRGIVLSMEHKNLAALLNLLISIVEVCFDLGQHQDAESYADSGTKVAAGVLNPFAYADLYERKGDAQLAQGKTVEGLATYKRCEELCKTYEYFHRWKSVLGKQMQFYEREQMTRQRSEAESELARVQELERRGGQAGIKEAAAKQAASQPSHRASSRG